MSMHDDSCYLSGGYFITRLITRPDHVSSELLPERFLSLSSCIAHFLPATSREEWLDLPLSSRKSQADRLGVELVAMDQFMATVETEAENGNLLDYWVFRSPSSASRIARFLPENEWMILGTGLIPCDIEQFIEEERTTQGDTAIFRVAESQSPLSPGGQVLGFELLGLEFGSFHSWLCNSLEKDCHQRFGTTLNKWGLINNRSDADICNQFIETEEAGAEPILWFPWQVVRYATE